MKLPKFADGTTYADQAWWSETAEKRWGEPIDGPGSDWSPQDQVWARCWAYIEERNLPAEVCGVVWAIACAAIDAMEAGE